MSYISPALNFIITAVKKAGNGLTRDFSEIEKLQSSVKAARDFAVSAVSRVEKTLRLELGKVKPNYAFAVDGKPQPAGPHFIVSALDGVLNLAHGIPHFSISVATVENGVLTSCVIYNPATDELFFAEKGNGAYKEGFRNHERLRVSARKEVAECIVATEPSYKEKPEEYFALCDKMFPAFAAIRVMGASSLDLAFVAAGKLDAAVSLNNSLSSMAAGLLLVKEAGGYVYELNQKDIRSEDVAAILRSGNLIAANANVAGKVYELINK